MKLLDKQTISNQKNLEREKEIKEAVKLAQTTDSLRKLASEEQERLTKFRDESLKQINEDIKRLSLKKNSIIEEVNVLKAEKIELLKPLDKEWAKLKTEKESFEKQNEDLSQRISQFLADACEQENRQKEIVLEESRVLDLKKSAEVYLSGAVSANSRAIVSLEKAESKASEIIEKANQREEQVITREAKIAVRERDIENKDSFLKKKEKRLINKEKAIDDKYATLLRAQKYVIKRK